jgi:hypothetical protein
MPFLGLINFGGEAETKEPRRNNSQTRPKLEDKGRGSKKGLEDNMRVEKEEEEDQKRSERTVDSKEDKDQTR